MVVTVSDGVVVGLIVGIAGVCLLLETSRLGVVGQYRDCSPPGVNVTWIELQMIWPMKTD